ncbi:lycopene cyclase domain-containing protein [Candidatus Roizmanbacteria bacterium]|nr:lycopene cyclase domain-containing protein [Candidatus Roizmanbacteria bacterium]
MHHFEYFIVELLCFSFPLIFTLIHRKTVAKQENLKVLNPTVFLASIPFLIWDVLVTARGHWSFNPDYITGIKLANLPIEEVLFFLLIPQSCLLIWVAMNRYTSLNDLKKDILHHFENIHL